jgi:hypothetical protein
VTAVATLPAGNSTDGGEHLLVLKLCKVSPVWLRSPTIDGVYARAGCPAAVASNALKNLAWIENIHGCAATSESHAVECKPIAVILPWSAASTATGENTRLRPRP